MKNNSKKLEKQKKTNIFNLLKPYRGKILFLAFLSISASGLGLILPKIISHTIDSYTHSSFVMKSFVIEFGIIVFGIFIFTYLQSIAQTYVSERVAKDLRNTIALKISKQSYEFIEKITPSRILTNLTSDIDSIKMFVGQAIASLISAVVIILGAAILLLTIDWKLALAVLGIIPIIAFLFFFIFKKAKFLMKKSREVIDWLNKVINENILGAALVRVLNSQGTELNKFEKANSEAKSVGLQILNMFAALIPIIGFVANLATLVILVLGGHFVITHSMSLGNFAAFNSYVAILIFPVLLIGIMSNLISRAQASYDRIQEILSIPEENNVGKINTEIKGDIEFDSVEVSYEQKKILKDISFKIEPQTKTAIIGPTAAGKTQLLYLLTRLITQNSGSIFIDKKPISEYDPSSLHQQIGFVFQDSIIFNLTLKENIEFGGTVDNDSLEKAIKTAELSDFIESLHEGLDTVISERGSSISGGQKQRIMLARALILNPKVLLLDDFTARVDNKTEKKILSNLAENYKDLTLISVTQKISSIEHYDKIILLMEGEIVASGTHTELLTTSLEYAQIYDSQKSTNNYE